MSTEPDNKPDTGPWFAVRDLTRANVPVRLLLPGGAATGFMMVDPKSRERSFRVRRDSGAADVLPFEPYAWRPLDGQAWPDPLPPPMTLASSGRFVDVRPRKLAAMQRQAEQSAATMAEIEAEYGELPPSAPSGHLPRKGGGETGQWWLDPAAVTYSEPGAIDLVEAEGRVCRAILTDGLRAIETPAAFAGTAAGLANLVADSPHSEDADRRPRFEPTPRDVKDYLVAFGWFARMAPVEMRPSWAGVDWLSGGQKVLVWRALLPPMSWRQIARRAGGSQEGWRKTWGGALECVRRVANGEQPLRHVAVADQLAALRERNRAFKRAYRACPPERRQKSEGVVCVELQQQPA